MMRGDFPVLDQPAKRPSRWIVTEFLTGWLLATILLASEAHCEEIGFEREVALEGQAKYARSVRWSPDGRFLVTQEAESGTLRIWGAKERSLRAAIEGVPNAAVSVVPGRLIASSAIRRNGRLLLEARSWGLETGSPERSSTLDAGVAGEDGETLVVGAALAPLVAITRTDGRVRVFDVEESKLVLEARLGRDGAQGVRSMLSDDGKTLLRVWREGDRWRLHARDLASGAHRLDGQFPDGTTRVYGFSGSHDGQSVVTAHAERHGDLTVGVVSIWSLVSARRERQVTRGAETVGNVLIAPDGHHLLTTTNQVAEIEENGAKKHTMFGLVRFWSTSTGRRLRSTVALRSAIVSAALSPQGTAVAFCGLQGQVEIWSIRCHHGEPVAGVVAREVRVPPRGVPRPDLARIERRVREEPVYTSESPGYALLVFGPEAENHIWIVQDGNHLWVDRNGDGDLTDSGEKLWYFEKCRIRTSYGKEFFISAHRGGDMHYDQVAIAVGQTLYQAVAYDDTGTFRFASTPEKASIVHFDGPLRFLLVDSDIPSKSGAEGTIRARIGTPGLGAGTFASISYCLVPRDTHPEVDVVFPAAEGGKPQSARARLERRC